MRQRTTLIIALIVLIACGLAGGLAAQASFTGSSGPSPRQPAALPDPPDLSAGGNPVISYQGVLQEGVNPYGEDTVDMEFRIYQGTPAVTQVWKESQQDIKVSGSGYFSTLIGTGSPISQGLFSETDDEMYLEVVVGTQTMTPLQRLAGVPYAFHAYYSGTAAYAHDADALDGKVSADFLDKATYDNDTNNVVDHATLANTAIYANDADKLDNNDSAAFMLKTTYDSDEDDDVDYAELAEAAANWTPQMTAGENITAGQVVGINESGALVAGCGSFGLPTAFSSPNKISDIDIDAFPSANKVAITYYDNAATQGKAVICELSGDTWTCGAPVTFNAAATSFIDVACYTIDSTDYIAINYISSYIGYGWAGKVTDKTITPGTPTASFNYDAASDATMDRIPGTNDFVIAYNTASTPKAVIGRVTASGGGNPTIAFCNKVTTPSTTYMKKASVDAMSTTRFVVSGINTTSDNGLTYIGKMNLNNWPSSTISYFKMSSYYYSGNVTMADVGSWDTDRVIVPFVNKDYYNASYNSYGTYGYGQTSGVDPVNISFGDYMPFRMGGINHLAMDISSGELAAIAYMDISDKGKGKVSLLDLSDSNNITTSKEQMFSHSPVENVDIVWLDSQNYAIAYSDIFDNSIGNIVLGKSEWVEPVGIAKTGGSGTIGVAIGGVVHDLSGLVSGTTYYGTIGGTLTTKDTGCKIGRAVSTTARPLSIDAGY